MLSMPFFNAMLRRATDSFRFPSRTRKRCPLYIRRSERVTWHVWCACGSILEADDCILVSSR